MKKKFLGFLSFIGISAIAFTVCFSAIQKHEVYALPIIVNSPYQVTVVPLNSKIENNTLTFKNESGHEIKFEYKGYIDDKFHSQDKHFVFGTEANISLNPIKGASRIRNIDKVTIRGAKMNELLLYKVYFDGDTKREENVTSGSLDDQFQEYDLRGANCSYFCFRMQNPSVTKAQYVKSITIHYSCKPGSENV